MTAPGASPASADCQRWHAGRHTWRHARDGGFDARRYHVVPLPESIAKPFVVGHHYAGTYPAGRLAYGLLTDDHSLAVPLPGTGSSALLEGRPVVGVAVLSVPMQRSVLTNVFPDLEPYTQTLELGRLVLTDTPANAESWFLARAFELAADAGIKAVVSFSDPMPRTRHVLDVDADGNTVTRTERVTPGHVGVVYQALNAVACGRSTARRLTYLPRHGLVVSDRTLAKIRNGESGADGAARRLVDLGAAAPRAGQEARMWLRAALEDLGAVRVAHPGNFRYAWPLGTPAQRRRVRIGLPRTGYPKPATDLLAAA